MNKLNGILLTALLLVSSLVANDVVVQNYGHTNEINAMIEDGDGLLWLATPGGLASYDIKNDRVKSLFHNPDDFPDIHLTSLALDDEGDLWIGTYRGILYRRDKEGNQEAFHDLELNESRINTLKYHQGLLYVGHTKGISVFEVKSQTYRGTAIQFGNLSNKSIVDIKFLNDTLFAVFDQSTGQVLSFPDVTIAVLTIAFSTPSSWNVVELYAEDEKKNLKSIQIDSKNGMQGFNGPSIRDGDDYIYAIDSTVYRGRFVFDTLSAKDTFKVVESKEMKSGVISLFHSSLGGVLFSGHKVMSFWRDPFGQSKMKHIIGLRKPDLQKLFLQSDGTLWMIPLVNNVGEKLIGKNEIITIKRGEYKYYGNWNSGFGTIGESFLFQAVSEGPDGAMWFGNSGDFPKRYKNGTWQRLIIDHTPPHDQPPYWVGDNKDYGFTKIDGIHVDDNNIVWGSFVSWGTSFPMFWVYNVKTEEFRFWGTLPSNAISGWKFTEGANGHKILSFRDDKTWGKNFVVIDGEVDIFDSTQAFDDIVLDKDTLRGDIRDISTSERGTFILGTNEGYSARYYKQGALEPVKFDGVGDYVISFAVGHSYKLTELDTIDDTTVITKELVRTDLWTGLYNGGIALAYLKEYVSSAGEVDSLNIVKDTTFSTLLSKANLIATSPLSMVFDKKSDNLWVASTNGLSRVVLNRKTMTTETSEQFYLYPNPYRMKEHSIVTIKGVAKDAFVDIYTSSGQLVEHITKEGQFFTAEDDNGIHYFQWRPSDKLAPGTYFVVAKNEERTDVVLQKLLILP